MYSSRVGGSDSSHGKSYFTVLYECYGVYTKKSPVFTYSLLYE